MQNIYKYTITGKGIGIYTIYIIYKLKKGEEGKEGVEERGWGGEGHKEEDNTIVLN